MERAAGIVAGGAVATALVAMIIEQSAVVIVGGILSAIVGPYAYWQQTRLTDIKALKETQRAVQNEVDRLSEENKRLSKNIDDLTESVDNLKDIEDALDTITKTQGQSVSAFEQQVQENRANLEQMESNLKTSVLQNLISVVLSSDADKNEKLSDEEIDDLVRRIRNISGVEIHEDRFRGSLQGQSVDSVLNLVQNLLNDDTPKEERIFELSK